MKQVNAKVISNTHILSENKRNNRRTCLESKIIWLNCPDIASIAIPGQFIMVRCGGECILPRPFAIFKTNNNDLAIFYSVWESSKGTTWLAKRQINDDVNLIGPLGNGFTIDPVSENLLLIAGGMGIAPLYYLGQLAHSQKFKVTIIYGTESRDSYPISSEINHIRITEDGSIGIKGLVTDVIPQYIEGTDQVFACGPTSMIRNMILNKANLKLNGKRVQVSLEVRMGCGTGICYGCTVRTRDGLKQVCKDGPVFNLDDFSIDDFPG